MYLTPLSILQLLFDIYTNFKICSKFCEELYTSKFVTPPELMCLLLYPKLLVVDLSHVDSDNIYIFLSFSFFLYLLYFNSPFHISSLAVVVSFQPFQFLPFHFHLHFLPLCLLFSLKCISPLLTLMSKGLYSNRVFFQKGPFYFHYNPQRNIPVLQCNFQ